MPTPATILRMAAFTNRPDGGNPAGVVLDAGHLSDADMLAIAADLGYSETAFISAGAGGPDEYTLRFFSPLAEVAFCGHATIATAVALAAGDEPGTVTFQTPAGRITVTTRREPTGDITATLTSPQGRSALADPQLLEHTLDALGWSPDDLDPAMPAHVANAGNNHLIINAATRERLAELDYDMEILRDLMEAHHLTTVHLSYRISEEEYAARDPFPVGGVYEDPATGAAAAAFGAYLTALHGPADRSITIHQGDDMGRPSTLTLTTHRNTTTSDVTGTAVPL